MVDEATKIRGRDGCSREAKAFAQMMQATVKLANIVKERVSADSITRLDNAASTPDAPAPAELVPGAAAPAPHPLSLGSLVYLPPEPSEPKMVASQKAWKSPHLIRLLIFWGTSGYHSCGVRPLSQ